MKIRTDFVTNSSSSSFVISTKGVLTKEDFQKLLGVEKDHYLNEYIGNFVTYIYNQYKNNLYHTKDEYVNYMINRYYNTYEELQKYNKNTLDLFDKGYVVSVSTISSETDDGWEMMLYENGIDVDTDMIKMEIE